MSARHELLAPFVAATDALVTTLTPQDDLSPQVVFLDGDGHKCLIDASMIADPDETIREVTLVAIAQVLHERGAVAAVLCQYAWGLSSDVAAKAIEDGVRPRNHPARREECVVIAVDNDGVTYNRAPVVRSSIGQMLGVWETHDSADGMVEARGLTVNLLRLGVKRG